MIKEKLINNKGSIGLRQQMICLLKMPDIKGFQSQQIFIIFSNNSSCINLFF